jgi:hypothetical protein
VPAQHTQGNEKAHNQADNSSNEEGATPVEDKPSQDSQECSDDDPYRQDNTNDYGKENENEFQTPVIH